MAPKHKTAVVKPKAKPKAKAAAAAARAKVLVLARAKANADARFGPGGHDPPPPPDDDPHEDADMDSEADDPVLAIHATRAARLTGIARGGMEACAAAYNQASYSVRTASLAIELIARHTVTDDLAAYREFGRAHDAVLTAAAAFEAIEDLLRPGFLR